MGNYSLEVEVRSKAPSLNQLLSKGWRYRHFSFLKIKQEIINQVSGKLPDQPLNKFKISVNRHATRTLDFDNFVASLKPIIDGLVLAGIIQDDNWDLINRLSVAQTKVKKGAERILVMVEEITCKDQKKTRPAK